MQPSPLCLCLCVLLVAAVCRCAEPDFTQFVRDMALNESIARENDRFMAGRQALLDANMAPNGNPLTGAPDFSCAAMGARSAVPPASVHSLRANDIAVVAAMGDSLTAGLGAGANTLLENLLEFRGLSFSIGGDGDLKYSATIPNILSEFNKMLVGASRRVSPRWFTYFSQFNVALSGATAENMTEQATELVKRIKANKEISFDSDWKMVTMFIGSNDLCHYCKDADTYSVAKYESHLDRALAYLHENLPRALVNMVSIEHPELLDQVDQVSDFCKKVHQKTCPCVNDKGVMPALVTKYQNVVHSLAKKYSDIGGDAFTVVAQTYLENSAVPKDKDGQPDVSFFAPDCFHFSHWAHALMAKALWNNLFEPVGAKRTAVAPAQLALKCPPGDCPLVRTAKNSDNCMAHLPKTALVGGEQFNNPYIGLVAQPAANATAASTKAPAPVEKVIERNTIEKETKSDTIREMIPVPVAVPVGDQSTGLGIGLIMLGLAFGLLIGLVVGSLAYQACLQRRRRQYFVANEKTPLLHQGGGEHDEYVQVY